MTCPWVCRELATGWGSSQRHALESALDHSTPVDIHKDPG